MPPTTFYYFSLNVCIGFVTNAWFVIPRRRDAIKSSVNMTPDVRPLNNGYSFISCPFQVSSQGQPSPAAGQSRVAAVGPYIQSSTMPRGPARHDLLKPTYPDGTATLPPQDSSPGTVPAPGKPDKGMACRVHTVSPARVLHLTEGSISVSMTRALSNPNQLCLLVVEPQALRRITFVCG